LHLTLFGSAPSAYLLEPPLDRAVPARLQWLVPPARGGGRGGVFTRFAFIFTRFAFIFTRFAFIFVVGRRTRRRLAAS
jgi:hypothetical protein